MAKYAVIHAATRVLINYQPNAKDISEVEVGAGHEAVPVADDFVLQRGRWKLDADNKTLITPTDADLDAAFTKAPSANAQAVIDACDVIRADAVASTSAKALAAALKTHFTPRKRGLMPE